MDTVRIVFPECDFDAVSNAMRLLTKTIADKLGDDAHNGYGLGGEHGYGEHWNCPVFEMRPFYWGDCTCGAMDAEPERDCEPTCPMALPNFRHKASGFEIRWYKYIGRDMEISGKCPDLQAMLNECCEAVGNWERA